MTENPQHRSGEDEFVPAGDDQVAERLAAMTEEEAEARAASLRAGLADYELEEDDAALLDACLLYTSPSPRDKRQSRMPSSA